MWPCSSAAATVMTLAVLPGANWVATGMSVVEATLAGADGSNVGYWAIARMCPVPGCMTTIEQFFALSMWTRCAHSRSASYCMAGLIVSRRLRAATGWRTLASDNGIC